MFLTNTEIESINKEISALVSLLDEEGIAKEIDLTKPDARDGMAFTEQAKGNTKKIQAALMLKIVQNDIVKGIGLDVPGDLKEAEARAMEKCRILAVHNIVSALMVLRSLS